METEKSIKMNRLGLALVNLSYAYEYAEMVDMDEIAEEQERIVNEFKELFEVIKNE